MIRDPFYRTIVARLSDPINRLDPEAFERCAADLLRTIYPGLVPVRGGSDAGMDGAVADGLGSPFPLVTTTSDEVTRNLRRSLRSYVKDGGQRRTAVLATSCPLTARRRGNLFQIAKQEGFQLIQIHDQAAFADLLYRSPAWCRELLNLTSQPPALSAVPLTSRPLLGEAVVGREPDLTWLAEAVGDALLVGQPGSGKTHLLRALARNGGGLFLISGGRGELAAAIREQDPPAIFVDDAHGRLEMLGSLRHMRREIGAEFRIIATSWPGEQLDVAGELGLTTSAIRNLELLTRREIAEVIRGCGIRGPKPLLRELIDQAKGRPGLAVTLSDLCLRGGTGDLASGAALFEDVRQTFQPLVGGEAIDILASFAVGGTEGMEMGAVASALGLSIVQVRHAVVRLAAGGVLDEKQTQRLVVQPEALRHALVGAVFFAGARSLPLDAILNAVPDRGRAVLTLVGAAGRGAPVPDELLRGLLGVVVDGEPWMAYASLGREQTSWVLERRRDVLIGAAWGVLRTAPDLAIPRLLDAAVGDDRAEHAHPEHPLRLLHDWIKSAAPGGGQAVSQRRTLLDGVRAWMASGSADPAVCMRALVKVFDPAFEGHESDPVDWTGPLIIHSGSLLPEELIEVQELWPEAFLLVRAADLADWPALREMIRDWAYPGLSIRGAIEPAVYDQMNAFAQRIMRDVAAIAGGHPAVLSYLSNLAHQRGWDVPCGVDPIYEILFPNCDHADYQATFNQQAARATQLAAEWAMDPADEVAERLVRYSSFARDANHTWPRFGSHVAEYIARNGAPAIEWALAMVRAGGDAALVGPFLREAVRAKTPGWATLWEQCQASPAFRGISTLAVLMEPAVPEFMVERALENIEGLWDSIQTACLRREVPEHRVPGLLRHSDPRLAGGVARALWEREPVGQVFGGHHEDWRRAVVAHLQDAYTLQSIFDSDAAIAFDWLAARVGKANTTTHAWSDDEPFTAAAALLTRAQREELIGMLTRDTYPREIVSLLVDKDSALYQRVLERPDLLWHHLEPLRGEPDIEWLRLARVACVAGYSPEEIARSARGMMWEWEGLLSNMWARWAALFSELALDPDPFVAQIGRAGLEEAEGERDRALKAERAEAIFGR